MKHLLILPILLFSFNLWARGPVDPVSPPWPLSISTLPVDFDGLPGEWVAYGHNTIWFIDIEPNANGRGLSGIHIKSNAIRTHDVDGWLGVQQNALVGQVAIDSDTTLDIMIFRDREGTKLRLGSSGDKYYDLKLYKRQKSQP